MTLYGALKTRRKFHGSSYAVCCLALRIIMLFVPLALSPSLLFAQTEPEFYRGKTVIVGVPSDPGGGYDLHGRLFANHLSNHIPGNPNVITQNVTAGGGLVLANNLFTTAPKDGTYIALLRASVLYEDIFGLNTAVRFKGREFNWIGNLNSSQDTCVFRNNGYVSSPSDFYKKEIIVGADGVAGMDYSFPRIYNEILGTKFKIVMGYKGTPDRILAMERGEIEGACGVTTSQLKATLSESYLGGRLKIIAQAGLASDPDFPDVPNMLNRAESSGQRRVLEFLFAQLKINRSVAVPPGTPAERVALLRKAFDAVTKDPSFLSEAKRQRIDINTLDGAETAAAVESFYNSPKDMIEIVRTALGAEPRR